MVEQVDRDFREWIVTVEQADAIVAGDREALNKFYFDNYDGLKGMATRYLLKRGLFRNLDSNVDAMMNNLYLDLPLFRWENGITITADIIHHSFAWFDDEGYAVRKSQGLPVVGHVMKGDKRVSTHNVIYLNPNITMSSYSELVHSDNDKLTLGDTVQAPKEDLPFYNYINRSLSAKEICGLLSSYFNKRELKVLEGMLEGYTPGNLREFVGYSDTCCRRIRQRIHQRLVLNYKEILSLLVDNGVVWRHLDGIVPPDYEEIAELSATNSFIKEPRVGHSANRCTAEYRAKNAQRMRESRARKKAQEAAQAADKETPSESGTA